MAPKLLISCPVYKRDWILKAWFSCIENQTFPLSDIGFIFELGEDDDETHQILFDWHSSHPEVGLFDARINNKEKHYEHPVGHRAWSYTKYYAMIEFRNNLLELASCYNPEKYFSLDSDILLENPNTIQALWDLTDRRDIDAVSPLMYMTPKGKGFPSVMSWSNNSNRANRYLDRYPIGELFESDVIMAAKMMSKSVYKNVRYVFHPQGEDLGWSRECKRLGYRLWSASNIYAPHIMSKADFASYEELGDSRTP